MKCPTCPDSSLAMTDRQGIEIDYCPQCRGVWLDRGELDKLMDRAESITSVSSPSATAIPVNQVPAGFDDRHQRRDHDHDNERNRQYYSHPAQGYGYAAKRKKSWISEIFD